MATPAAPAADNPYGLMQALQEGGIISWSVFIILVVMSLGTFYILFTKLMQQQKIMSQGRKVRASFWNSPNLKEASSKLDAKSAYRAIVDDTLVAQEQHGKLTNPVDQHDWNRIAPGLSVRTSAGVARWEPLESVESVLHRADEALYRAKDGGRNRTERA